MIVAGRDGVALVVVAAGAGDHRGLERLGERVELVVDDVVPDHPEVDAGVVVDLAEPVEGGPDGRLVEPAVVVPAGVGQEVAGDLLADEPVVGQVVVEGPDDVVPIAPGVGNIIIPLVPVRLREPDHVQPVPREPLPEPR